MVDLKELEKYYPENLRVNRRFILREYLQYRILELIYNGSFANKLFFLGGTCLRIVHNNQRFSEDLDFDNTGLHYDHFKQISFGIERQLSRLGYEVEMKSIPGNAFHCYLKFPGILYRQGLSGYAEEKILIQLDTEPQDFLFTPGEYILNKFDIFTRIFITPVDLLLSQKIWAIINRKRKKGRDFYDAIFLMSKAKPNYAYLDQKAGISSPDMLKEHLLSVVSRLDLNKISKDVEPFLFNPAESKRILLFPDYIKQADF